MNEKQLQDILARMGEKKVESEAHQTLLRRALLSLHTERSGFSLFKTALARSYMTRSIIPAGTLVAFILIIGTGLSVTNTGIAEAQELVERSIARAIAIPVEMREALEAQMKADMMETLEEAYAAPDLRILTREEYEEEGQFTFSTTTQPGNMKWAGEKAGTISISSIGTINNEETDVIMGEAHAVAFSVHGEHVGDEPAPEHGYAFTKAVGVTSGGVAMSGETTMSAGTFVGAPEFKYPVKYLSYTSPRGGKVVLGLDENDTPVFRMEELSADSIIHGPNGEIGIQGKVMKMINVQMKSEN